MSKRPELPVRHAGPLWEEFEAARPAGPVELLVIKAGRAFLCARPDGDLRPGALSGEGLYADDTRHLSELRLSFGGTESVRLSHSVESGYRAVVHATNPAMVDAAGVTVPQETLSLRRSLLIGDRLYYSVAVRNFHRRRVTVPLTLSLAADFADLFEVRGVRGRAACKRATVPKAEDASVVFGYEGRDGVMRETLVELEPAPKWLEIDGERVRVGWEIELDEGGERQLLIAAAPAAGGRRPPRRGIDQASAELDAELDAWARDCTGIETDNELFQSVVTAAVRDLQALLMPAPGGRIPAAGIPWFVAPFGRDSLLTSYESLLLDPKLARHTLIVLAHLQARTDEPWRDAEPGKILHELRAGELAHAGLIPHTPYYGSADATPLFIMLAAAYFRWTADLETLTALRPALEAALEWIDRHGDGDSDGFVEYERRSPDGLANQGWKDSEDAILHADGTRAEGPIALVEVQAYVYLAKLRIAEVYEALGEADRARELRGQAQALREVFNEAFWAPEEGTFALALDGRKRQVASVTSNPGHCLYCGIVEPEKAVALAERLMAPDMWAGWGIRTLSAESPAYNPMSYHNGSIWPHDNAIIAAGLKRYGHTDGTERIATALFDVAARARDFRLAELYCGFDRRDNAEIVSYPMACMPQAWAAAAPFMLLQAMLGITAHAPTGTLRVMQPNLPPWLGRAELRRLRVGAAAASLAFTKASGVTQFSLLEQQGQVTVTLAAAPP